MNTSTQAQKMAKSPKSKWQIIFTLLMLTIFKTPTFAQVNVPVTDPNICWEGVTESEMAGAQLRLFRFPKDYAINGVSGYYNASRATSTAGVAMRIKTSSSTVNVTFTEDLTWAADVWGKQIAVYRDDVYQNTYMDAGASVSINLTNPGGGSVEWKFVLPTYSQMNLESIQLQSGGSLESISCGTKPVYLAIGNSITMGVGSVENGSKDTYSRLVAESEGYELYNWGIGGSKVYDGVVANLSSGIQPDFITILWGYNDVHSSGSDTYLVNNTFPQYEAIVDTLCRRFPSAKVMAILPTFTTNPVNTAARTIPILSAGQLSIIQNLQTQYSNLCYIDGWNYTDASGLSDAVHLNATGNTTLANGILENLNSCGSPCSPVVLGPGVSLCGMGSQLLNTGLTSAGGRTFSWTLDGSPIAGATGPTYNATLPGTYVATADSQGCIQFSQIIVSGTLPTVDLGSDVDLCSPSEVTLDAGVSGAGISYVWTKNAMPISGATSQTQLVSEPGTYEVTVSAAGCPDESDDVTVTSSLLDATGDTICSSGTANLSVSGIGSFEWFDQVIGGTQLGSGNTISPLISTSTTYYVEDAAGITALVGLSKPTPAGSGAWNSSNFSFRIRFTVSIPLIIDSISVYPSSTGNVTASILASDNTTVVDTKDFTSIVGGNVENRLPVDFSLTPGTYYLDFTGTGGTMYYSNENDPAVGYPYTVPGLISIEGADPIWFQNEPRYPYGYNWRVSTGNPCDRTPVHAIIDPGKPGCITSVDETEMEFSFHPNPTSGIIQFNSEIQFQVMSILGKKLLEGKSNQANLSELPSGIYLVNINNSKTYRITRN